VTSALLVFVGAGLGGLLRYLIGVAALRIAGADFPWGTSFINVSGSFVMGCIAGYLAFRSDASWGLHTRLFVMTGILGGYTTFSSFSLEAVLLWERGALLASGAYVLGSVVLGIVGLVAGLSLVRALT
jgi:CrcB protein